MRTALLAVPAAAGRRPDRALRARRALAAASPFLAATSLTAAAFFLPSPGTGHEAWAFATGFEAPAHSSAPE